MNLHSRQLAEGNATNYAAERSPPKRLKPVGFLSFHITDSSLALLPQDSQYVTTWLEELPVILPVNQWPTLLLQLKHGLNERLPALSENLINNGHEGHGREQDCGRVNNFYQMSWYPLLLVVSILATTGCHHSGYSCKYRCTDCGNILNTELGDFQTNISTSDRNTMNVIFLPWHLTVCIFFEIMARTMQLSWLQKPKGKSEFKKKVFSTGLTKGNPSMKLFCKTASTFGNRPIHLCLLYHGHVTSLQKIALATF